MVDTVNSSSRYANQEPASTSNNSNNSSVITRDTGPSSSSTTGDTNNFSSETVTNFDPATQDALNTIIQQLLGGGTADQKKNNKQRTALMSFVEQMLGQYTKQAAFSDANNLMQLNLQQSMDKNMPAIAKSIEGAGTSASSMQGLLSQKLATDSAMQSGALGAEQAKAYAGASTNLASILEALSRPDNSVVGSLIGALQTAKGGTVNRTVSQTGTSSQNTANSGRTDTTNVQNTSNNGTNNLLNIQPTGGNSLVNMAANSGYNGDLRAIASRSDTGQSVYDYVGY